MASTGPKLTRIPDRNNPSLALVLGLFCSGFLAWTLLSGAHGHSYADYLAEWREIILGRDPWGRSDTLPFNAYGPLFNVLAVLTTISPIAGKLLFALTYCAFVVWAMAKLWPTCGHHSFPWPLALFCIFNPFPWVEIAHFGFFDVLVGIACVGAVHARLHGRDLLSGTSIAAGILLKLVPFVILPFLVVNRTRIHVRLASACLALVILGFGLSLLVWGPSTFAPMLFAGERGPVLSVYAFLGGGSDADLSVSNLAQMALASRIVLASAGLALFAWCVARNVEPALAALLAMLCTLLFYQVGYNNYQMMLFVLAAYWMARDWERLKADRMLLTGFALYFTCLAMMDVLFPIVRRVSEPTTATQFLDAIYFLKFLLGCALLFLLLRYSLRQTRDLAQRMPASAVDGA